MFSAPVEGLHLNRDARHRRERGSADERTYTPVVDATCATIDFLLSATPHAAAAMPSCRKLVYAAGSSTEINQTWTGSRHARRHLGIRESGERGSCRVTRHREHFRNRIMNMMRKGQVPNTAERRQLKNAANSSRAADLQSPDPSFQ